MTALHHIHEAGILHNLGKRAKEQKPYTFMVSAARGAVRGLDRVIRARGVFASYIQRAQHRAAQGISS